MPVIMSKIKPSVCRRLQFDDDEEDETADQNIANACIEEWRRRDQEASTQRWNYDFVNDRPLQGPYEWVAVIEESDRDPVIPEPDLIAVVPEPDEVAIVPEPVLVPVVPEPEIVVVMPGSVSVPVTPEPVMVSTTPNTVDEAHVTTIETQQNHQNNLTEAMDCDEAQQNRQNNLTEAMDCDVNGAATTNAVTNDESSTIKRDTLEQEHTTTPTKSSQ